MTQIVQVILIGITIWFLLSIPVSLFTAWLLKSRDCPEPAQSEIGLDTLGISEGQKPDEVAS